MTATQDVIRVEISLSYDCDERGRPCPFYVAWHEDLDGGCVEGASVKDAARNAAGCLGRPLSAFRVTVEDCRDQYR